MVEVHGACSMSSSTAMCESILHSCKSSVLLRYTLVVIATLILVKWLLVGEAFVIGVTRIVYPDVVQGTYLYKAPTKKCFALLIRGHVWQATGKSDDSSAPSNTHRYKN